MKFIELSVLTVIKKIDGKGESKTTYCKKLLNTSHIVDAMDDPEAKDLLHVTIADGSKLLAEGNLEKLKKMLK
jgi:hypothetical protein